MTDMRTECGEKMAGNWGLKIRKFQSPQVGGNHHKGVGQDDGGGWDASEVSEQRQI